MAFASKRREHPASVAFKPVSVGTEICGFSSALVGTADYNMILLDKKHTHVVLRMFESSWHKN